MLKFRHALSGAILFLAVFAANKAYAVEGTYSFEVEKETPVVMNVAGEKISAGVLLPNVEYSAAKDGEKLLVPFSNLVEGLPLNESVNVLETTEPSQSSLNPDMVITSRQIVVFDNVQAEHAIGILNRNIRYAASESSDPKWLKINFAGREGYILKSFTEKDEGIPVLMYHHILKDSENVNFHDNMTVSYDEFQKQMDYLQAKGFRTIDLPTLEQYLKYNQNLPGKVVVLTFDDGLVSTIHYAYPILQEKHFIATDFVIGCRLYQHSLPFNPESLQYMGFNDIVQYKDVFSYESHTYAMHLRDKDTFTPYMQMYSEEEVEGDLLHWNEFTGLKSTYLAYPWGQFNKTAETAAAKAGIHMAFTTETGNVKIGDPMLMLKRQGVSRYHNMDVFTEKVENN
ncbi:polysaccharide deacetylase family protein [Falsibacillus pallidus]|uniref:Polysaccharide deacetylase n=1 Tax=Falsibacillus pallidus TaxID=493781 RepID=A0A370G868_9BACI|nr:polysaccharide deacetylase family protein [Falsibacillus pallidus]RDI39995.1 polysaccharide deacetylase [Falsibacillus pallidus]